MIFVDVVVVALVIGRLLGGRFSALASVSIRGIWLAFTALLLQAIAFPVGVFPWQTPDSLARILWLASYALLIGMLALNVHLRGTPIIAAGLACNLAAIVANRGLMPVRPSALATAGRHYHVHLNSIASTSPHLAALVDRWAVPGFLPFGNVFSIGDALIAAGTIVVVAMAMRSGEPSPPPVVERSRLGASSPPAA